MEVQDAKNYRKCMPMLNKRSQPLLHDLLLKLCNIFASDIHDYRTGEKIGRALMIPWKGRIIVIGAQEDFLVAEFQPQSRLTYWKQELGFTKHPQPDFENVRPRS